MFSLLNINKPAGLTSRDVVNRVQRVVGRKIKAGHAGTLDPLATGVLVIALGQATKLIEYVQQLPKRYVGEFLLGQTSDTEDVTGKVELLENPPQPTREELEAFLPRFIGTIQQRPPAFSALKVAGQRAYDLARQGQAVELAARPIEIHSLQLLDYDYPRFTLDVRCGSGTYIRSLGRDIGEALGSGAVMNALQRTEIGPFCIGQAVSLESLDKTNLQQHLQSPLLALAALPRVQITPGDLARLKLGQAIAGEIPVGQTEAAAVDPEGRLAAILVSRGNGQLGPVKNFCVEVPQDN